MLSVVLSGIALGAIYSSVPLVYNLPYATSRVLSITAGFTFMIGGVLGAYFIDIAKLQPIVGFLATLFNFLLNAYPFDTGTQPLPFAIKILAVTLLVNIVGYGFYRLRNKPSSLTPDN